MEPRQGREMLARFASAHCQFTLLGLWSKPRRVHIHDPHRLSEAYFDRCYATIDSAIANIAGLLEIQPRDG
jgi:protein-tyrosine phosphatase